jgi:hypothetical protein
VCTIAAATSASISRPRCPPNLDACGRSNRVSPPGNTRAIAFNACRDKPESPLWYSQPFRNAAMNRS